MRTISFFAGAAGVAGASGTAGGVLGAEYGFGAIGIAGAAGVPGNVSGFPSAGAGVCGDAGVVGATACISGFFESSVFVQLPAKMSAVKSRKETTRRGFFILPHFAGSLRRV